MKSVDLVVPCYNEGLMIDIFYKETQTTVRSIRGYSFRYIFVDDGSTDNTFDLIKELAKNNKDVKYISFSRNFGKEAGIYAGLKKSTADLVVVIDADLQHPPSLLIDMIKAAEEGYDSCSARRVSRRGEPRIRSFFASKFYKLINSMSDIDIVDGAVDYRMMTRQMVDAILELNEVQRFSKGIFTWVGFRTKWVEFENVERIAGETKWSFWKLFKYALDGITAFTTTPLRFASFVGIGISTVAFCLLIYELIRTLIFGIGVPGYLSTLFMLTLVGGIMILTNGILGEYIAKMYLETKRRPIYIEKSSNFDARAEADAVAEAEAGEITCANAVAAACGESGEIIDAGAVVEVEAGEITCANVVGAVCVESSGIGDADAVAEAEACEVADGTVCGGTAEARNQ
ncbi:MAG: glycosyltransferase family 2 protein [Synergistaceae bacterium]|nr:glycosyltransferase family 2 protein [Synergistaceae bacterium]